MLRLHCLPQAPSIAALVLVVQRVELKWPARISAVDAVVCHFHHQLQPALMQGLEVHQRILPSLPPLCQVPNHFPLFFQQLARSLLGCLIVEDCDGGRSELMRLRGSISLDMLPLSCLLVGSCNFVGEVAEHKEDNADSQCDNFVVWLEEGGCEQCEEYGGGEHE